MVDAWDWQGRWETGLTQWQKPEVDSNLTRYWDTVSDQKTNLRVLVPLCGASLDMGWLYRKGNIVVGVEMVRMAADKAFALENLEYSVTKLINGKGWKYESTDKRYIILVANFLEITRDMVGEFDVVYDRRALEAMKADERESYVSVVLNLLGASFSYYLSGFDFNPRPEDTIPPRPLSLTDVKCLFGNLPIPTTITLLNTQPDKEQERQKNRPGIKLNTYLIKSAP